MPVTRRQLSFASLDDVVRDAENLVAKGYERVGNWDLAQVCSHLENWMRFPLDGYPKLPLVIRPMMWLMKVTIGCQLLDRILTKGFDAGGRTMPETVHPPKQDAVAAVAKLKETAARFAAHTGPIQPSQLFGTMDKETATKLQLAHCAHHLSFLVPKTA